MNKNTLIGIAVAIVIAIGGYQFPQVQTVTQNVLGAVSTLDGVDNPFTSINGNKNYYYSNSLTATSSFICSLQNPYRATSTIVSLGAESNNIGIAAANALYVSTSTTAYGTSTPNLIDAFPMGTGQWSVELQKNSATSTAGVATQGYGVQTELLPGRTQAGRSNYILGPSEFITWKIATTTGGTFVTYDTGTCTAILHKN